MTEGFKKSIGNSFCRNFILVHDELFNEVEVDREVNRLINKTKKQIVEIMGIIEPRTSCMVNTANPNNDSQQILANNSVFKNKVRVIVDARNLSNSDHLSPWAFNDPTKVLTKVCMQNGDNTDYDNIAGCLQYVGNDVKDIIRAIHDTMLDVMTTKSFFEIPDNISDAENMRIFNNKRQFLVGIGVKLPLHADSIYIPLASAFWKNETFDAEGYVNAWSLILSGAKVPVFTKSSSRDYSVVFRDYKGPQPPVSDVKGWLNVADPGSYVFMYLTAKKPLNNVEGLKRNFGNKNWYIDSYDNLYKWRGVRGLITIYPFILK